MVASRESLNCWGFINYIAYVLSLDLWCDVWNCHQFTLRQPSNLDSEVWTVKKKINKTNQNIFVSFPFLIRFWFSREERERLDRHLSSSYIMWAHYTSYLYWYDEHFSFVHNFDWQSRMRSLLLWHFKLLSFSIQSLSTFVLCGHLVKNIFQSSLKTMVKGAYLILLLSLLLLLLLVLLTLMLMLLLMFAKFAGTFL